MPITTDLAQIKQRRGTALEWSTANSLLVSGEFGVETDTHLVKMGDGVTLWDALTYQSEQLAAQIHLATAKTTLAGADEFGIVDSAASNVIKRISWTNVVAVLKTYFDSIYAVLGGYVTLTGAETLTNKDLSSVTNIFPAASSGIGTNALLNADLLINQRGFTSNTATGSYNFDRWLQQNVGGSCTVTPQAFTPGAAPIAGVEGRTFVQMITASQSAAGDYAMLTQRIEDVTKYAGQTIAISFYAKAGAGTPKIAVEVQQNFGTGGAPSATVSTPISAPTISTSWVRYTVSVAVPSITGKTLGTTPNTSYLEVNLWISSGATNATRASSIGIQNGTFSIWGVKLESGSTASAFTTAHASLAAELAACQRYFQSFGGSTDHQYFGAGFDSLTTETTFWIQYAVTMRAVPSFSPSAVGTFIDAYGSGWSSGPVIYQAGVNGTKIYFTGTGLTVGRGNMLRGPSLLTARLIFSAEL